MESLGQSKSPGKTLHPVMLFRLDGMEALASPNEKRDAVFLGREARSFSCSLIFSKGNNSGVEARGIRAEMRLV